MRYFKDIKCYRTEMISENVANWYGPKNYQAVPNINCIYLSNLKIFKYLKRNYDFCPKTLIFLVC